MKKLLILGTVLLLSASCSHYHGKRKSYWKMDANKDGVITKAEWMAKFNKKDVNGDGQITKEEMNKCHCKKSCDYKKKN
ncbi:MAG: hypothetical protein ACO20H_10170 [Bacteriovoracaceae bacterium]